MKPGLTKKQLAKQVALQLFFFIICAFMLTNGPVIAATDAEELKQLRAQLQMMMKRIEELEKKQAESEQVKNVDTGKLEKPEKQGKGVIDLMSEHTTLTVGGRIQMETYYDWNESNQGHLFYNVRDSRFWLKSRTKTGYGLLSATLEADFAGTAGNERLSNSHNPRLRHAYIQLGGLTLGQTNSLFNYIAAPDMLTEPIDDVFARQPQMRWTEKFDGGLFAISLEQPETTLMNSAGEQLTPGTDRFPDLIARYSWRTDWGETSLAVLGREIRQHGIVAGVSDEAYGGGLSLSGKYLFFDYDDLRFGLNYGNALGRYLGNNFFNAASVDDQGKIHLIPSIGGHIAYRHWWNEAIRSSIAFAHIQAENNHVMPATSYKLRQSYSANLIWIPLENAQLGLEYYYQIRKAQSGLKTDASRLLFKASYDF